MASRKKTKPEEGIGPPPSVLSDNFFGFELDEDQTAFRDAIWSPENDIIFCNARAGTGKTLVSVGTASLLVRYGLYQKIIYMMAPIQEQRVGFRPGETEKKIAPYFMPLFDVAPALDINPYTDINVCSDDWQESGSGYIDCMTDVFLRGRNIPASTVLIVDEAENFYTDELKKILTRVNDGAKVIIIGHTGQCDITKHPERSGFAPYISHFQNQPRCANCQLTRNHRGWISNHADSL